MSRSFTVTLLLGLAMLAPAGCLPAAAGFHPQDAVSVAREAGAPAVRDVASSGVFELSDPSRFDRVVAISDVHGMYQPLLRLLSAAGVIDAQQHWVGGKTLVMVVGDSIDKGPQSVEVMDLWMSLMAQAPASGGQVVHLLGNHEAEFLASGGSNNKAAELVQELQARNIPISDLTDPTRPRGAFLAGQPLAAKVGKWLFCHAGLFPNMTWAAFRDAASATLARRAYGDPLITGNNSILEAKDWWADANTRGQFEQHLATQGFFGLVQGHQPKAYGIVDRTGAVDGGHLIKLDNGMAPEAGANPGTILVFTQPSQLAVGGFPTAKVVAPDGSGAALTVSALTPVTTGGD